MKAADLRDNDIVSLSNYYRWRDGSLPQSSTGKALADFLNVRLDWLLKGEGPMIVETSYTERTERTVTAKVTEDRAPQPHADWPACLTDADILDVAEMLAEDLEKGHDPRKAAILKKALHALRAKQ
jgi:hypothetical protein